MIPSMVCSSVSLQDSWSMFMAIHLSKTDSLSLSLSLPIVLIYTYPSVHISPLLNIIHILLQEMFWPLRWRNPLHLTPPTLRTQCTYTFPIDFLPRDSCTISCVTSWTTSCRRSSTAMMARRRSA